MRQREGESESMKQATTEILIFHLSEAYRISLAERRNSIARYRKANTKIANGESESHRIEANITLEIQSLY